MKFIRRIVTKAFKYEYLKALYENPGTVVDVEFYNRGKDTRELWVEPSCESIQLDPETEYKIVTHDKLLRFEYDPDGRVIMYLQHSFGFKLYKREFSVAIPNTNDWILLIDHSDNN